MALDIAATYARLAELTPAELASLSQALNDAFIAADADDDVDIAKLEEIATQFDAVRARIAEPAPPPPVAEPVTPAAPAAAAEPEKPAEPVTEVPPVVEPAVEVPAEPVAVAEPVTAPETPAPAAEVTTITPEAPAAAEVQEGLPVAASASTTVAVPRGAEPVVASGPSNHVFAGHGINGFTAGEEIADGKKFGEALATRINSLLRLNGGDGEQVVIASIKAPAPDDRTLSMGDALGNGDKIRAVIDQDAMVEGNGANALVASGGCCAPLVTKYDLWDNGGDTSRPVKDSLAGFRADRGGIRFFAGPVLADLEGAVGFWTCTDDANADAATPSTWKVCARINCPPEQTAELQAVTMCLTFGVLQTRIFPELAVANNKMLLVAQARIADAALLAQIKAGSTAVTDGGTPWGAVRDLMNSLSRASMYYRDRYRIKTAPLRAIFPSWVLELMRTELMTGPDWGRDFSRHYGVSEDEVRSFFASRNINVTFTQDSSAPATLGGGFFPAISGAALPAFPTTVQWALFPEGAWLFLDGGQLDLGIVRDSTLVRTNDYMQFSETFEAAAHIGGESLWVTSTVSVSGQYPTAV
jgi:outer membrane biosynthesis protein TonB